jgi:hypothetical protein
VLGSGRSTLDGSSDWLVIGYAVRQEDPMSHYVDVETGEIIDVTQFRREQARIAAQQKNVRARKSRIYRHVREVEPQKLANLVYSIPRMLWDEHYGKLMGILGLLGALVLWMWGS